MFGETDTVSRRHRGENPHAAQAERLVRELGHDRALEGIKKADAENIIARLCDALSSRGRTNHRRMRELRD